MLKKAPQIFTSIFTPDIFRLRVPARLLSMIMGSLTLLPMQPSFADDYKPDEFEYAPERGMECSWSKLPQNEYKECQKKKAFFEKMSKKEREAYNAAVKKRRLEARIERIERVIPGIPVGK